MKEQIYEKLPKAFKNKWIAALRSGKFKQGRDWLEIIKPDGSSHYCCLGVACRIMHPKIKLTDKDFIIQKSSGMYNSIGFERLRDINVPSVLKGSNLISRKLASMNDTGISFKRIANWIEKYL